MSKTYTSWKELLVTSPVLCGIANVTPDSFSDGGKLDDENAIRSHCNEMIERGAGIIDVGAESTRPGAVNISDDDQLRRLEAVFNVVSKTDAVFSIDTRSAVVAATAIEKGFSIVNDVSGFLHDDAMAGVVADTHALCIVMHSRGTPETMSELTQYNNVVADVISELEISVEKARAAGVADDAIALDPGIGFAKTQQDNLELVNNVRAVKEHFGFPIVVGLSRKTFTSWLATGDTHMASIELRDSISASLGVFLADAGVDVLRVHNVEISAAHLKVSQQLKP